MEDAKHYHPLLIRPDLTGALGAVLDIKDEISFDDYERFRTSYWTIYDKLTLNMFALVRQSGTALFQALTSANDALANRGVSSVDPNDAVVWTTKLRLAILSFCSMLVYHQEQNLILASKKFGKKSTEFAEMKSVFAALYDGCFGYRYLYKLRNTMVHSTMEAVSASASAAIHQGQPRAMFDMILHRPTMVGVDGKLTEAMRAELSSLPGDPSVFQMAAEVIAFIAEANGKLTDVMTPEIDELCESVVEFDSLFAGESGVRALQVIDGDFIVDGAPKNLTYSAMASLVFDYAHMRVDAV